MKESTEVLLDELLKDYQTPEQILGENGILKQLTKRLAERALQAEMTHHLGYAKHDYQGKADKETLDDFINHEPDNELLEDELSSAEEENNQSANDETTTLAGKPARKKSNARNGTTKKLSVVTLGILNSMFLETEQIALSPSSLKSMNARSTALTIKSSPSIQEV